MRGPLNRRPLTIPVMFLRHPCAGAMLIFSAPFQCTALRCAALCCTALRYAHLTEHYPNITRPDLT